MRNVPFVLAIALGAATLLAPSNGHQFVVSKPDLVIPEYSQAADVDRILQKELGP